MKITELFNKKDLTLSFEVFPPKTDAAYDSVVKAAMQVASLKPDYMSVTYGAGGGTSRNTLAIAKQIQNEYDVPAIAHLTCVCATKEGIRQSLTELKNAGIENILALRGDRPKDYDGEPFTDYKYASELVEEIRNFGGFCIGGACYPEGHVDSLNKSEDINHLKHKVEMGCDYLTTQMFFDNNIFYNFLYKIREKGINVPVIPGIMPITRAIQVKTACELSGTNMPERFKNLVDRFGDNPAAMQQAGIAYATDQIIDLYANGIKHIHLYTMNKLAIAEGIKNNLSEIVK